MNAPLAPTIRMDDIDRGLVDSFQRGVAIVARPYAAIGEALGVREEEVMTRLGRLIAAGAVSRFGAVVRPHAAGASTLAALAAPPERLDAVAEIVSGFAGVTHNYAREHDWSLWFVVTGRDAADVAATLAGIGRRTGLAVLDLPLERAYHIDLGFPMFGAPATRTNVCACEARADATDRAILARIEGGLALAPRPFTPVAEALGLDETTILARLGAMLDAGIITRFGVVVKHRAFGYRANAMAVWDIADDEVDAVAEVFAREPAVTLCYRRPRRLPDWRYNLFCMIHATDRANAMDVITRLRLQAGAPLRHQATLFSTRCYKQRGASFARVAPEHAA